MITDSETNFVYFSDLIRTKYKSFWEGLEPILIENKILYGFIDNTKDVWCRDYMPVQISEKEFVQFKYTPDYLVEDKGHQNILSIQSEISIINEINPIKSDLIIDGGNIVMSKNSVIMTDKIFKENKGHKEDIIAELKTVLKVDNIIIIPMHAKSYDYTGHADGMVKFLDDNTLLVSDYSYYPSASWKKKMDSVLDKTRINIVTYPSVNCVEKNQDGCYTAKGIYINFAQIGNKILLPQFGFPEDIEAKKRTKTFYPNCHIIPIDSNDIAMDGGVLNCITWNIKQS